MLIAAAHTRRDLLMTDIFGNVAEKSCYFERDADGGAGGAVCLYPSANVCVVAVVGYEEV